MVNKNKKREINQNLMEELILEELFHRPINIISLQEIIKEKCEKEFQILKKNEFQLVYDLAKQSLIQKGEIHSIIDDRLDYDDHIYTQDLDLKTLLITTVKGINRLFNRQVEKIKGLSTDEFKDKIPEIWAKINQQSNRVRFFEKKFEKIEKGIEARSNEVIKIRDEFKKIQSEFYGKIIQIFSIFVAIFGFIIIGFTQIPPIVDKDKVWYINLGNTSAVFIPVVICIIILLLFVNRIIKKTIWK